VGSPCSTPAEGADRQRLRDDGRRSSLPGMMACQQGGSILRKTPRQAAFSRAARREPADQRRLSPRDAGMVYYDWPCLCGPTPPGSRCSRSAAKMVCLRFITGDDSRDGRETRVHRQRRRSPSSANGAGSGWSGCPIWWCVPGATSTCRSSPRSAVRELTPPLGNRQAAVNPLAPPRDQSGECR